MSLKKVAVIGGGIFGITIALELAKKFQVTLFEKENDIFCGATFVNHFRHHMGYHYPRSPETVKECKEAKNDFETVFGKALIPIFPCYYGVAKHNTQTSADEFLKFCQNQKLPYKIGYPENRYLDKNKVDICIKVPETVYDFQSLKEIAKRNVKKSKNLDLKLGKLITGGEIRNDGSKKLIICKGNNKESEIFDYVINATYSNYNLLCKAFGLEKKSLQFELVELNIITLPIKGNIGLTIMDGPFTSILPTGQTKYFTLGHVEASVHSREIVDESENEVIKKWGKIHSKKNEIIKKSSDFLPFLKDSTYIKSLYVTRVVKPKREFDDARPTEINDHGHGFFSIFAGKIITCVTTARKINKLLESNQTLN
jgi:hypothetical protein